MSEYQRLDDFLKEFNEKSKDKEYMRGASERYNQSIKLANILIRDTQQYQANELLVASTLLTVACVQALLGPSASQEEKDDMKRAVLGLMENNLVLALNHTDLVMEDANEIS